VADRAGDEGEEYIPNSLAQRMKTSRSQIGRLLDPKDGNVTLATLQRAARMVGRSLRLELV
jgi:antitoxin HicB